MHESALKVVGHFACWSHCARGRVYRGMFVLPMDHLKIGRCDARCSLFTSTLQTATTSIVGVRLHFKQFVQCSSAVRCGAAVRSFVRVRRVGLLR